MDPNATLDVIRDYVTEWQKEDTRTHTQSYDDLLEHIEALDEWLTKGGFLPADWTPRRVDH